MAHSSTYEVVFTFGKHKGSSLGYVADTDPRYLDWLVDADLFKGLEVWKDAAKLARSEQSVSDLSLPKLQNPKYKIPNKTDTSDVGIVLKNDKTAVVKFPYSPEWVQRIKSEIDGRKWNPDNKCWEFPVVQMPKVVRIFGGLDNVKLSDGAKAYLKEEVLRRRDLDEIRNKEDTDLEIDMKLPLYPFQRVAVEFVNRAGGRAMIADAMGLGKTIESVGFAILNNYKTLIVCPKSVTIQWSEEIKKFTGKNSTIWTTQSIEGHGNNQFHIINYDAVRKQFGKLSKISFDLLVCDEATNLKNRRTLRAKSVLGSWKERKKFPGIKTDNVLFLTGTPILNRPIEAYYLLNFLDSQRFNNFYHFTHRYGGWRGETPKNLTELHERTKDMVIRRLKKDVLPELPDKQRNDLYIEMSPGETREYLALLDELFRQWKFNGRPTVATMPKIQGFLTEQKLKRAKEIIDEMLENDRAVLVFSVYIDPLKRLYKEYEHTAELLYGDTPAKERKRIVERIQSGQSKLACVGLKAGGMGLDGLQHSIDTVIFLNLDWTPANHEQAEDRTHRIGQKNKVQVYYLLCENTIDIDMRELLSEKQKIAETITDGRLVSPAASRSYFKEFAKRISKRHGTDFADFGE